MLKHPRPEGLPLPGGRAQTPPPASPILSSTFFAQGKQRVRLRTSGRAGGGARRGEGRGGNHSQLFSNRLLTLVNSGSGATDGGRERGDRGGDRRLRVSGGGHSKREKERAKSSPSRSSQLPPIYKDGLTLERGRERERERAQQTSCNTGSLQRLNRNWPNAFCE